MALTSKLTNIANAIRAKTGRTEKLTLAQMPVQILSIKTDGIDPDSIFPFGGRNAELVATYEETFTLADTSFVIGSTSSTTATTIKAAVSNRFISPTIAIGDKDVVVVQRVVCEPVYDDTANGKAQVKKYAITYVSHIAKRRNSIPNATSETTRSVVNSSSAWLDYYSTSGTETFGNTSYGMYATPSGASVASTTAANTTVRASSPILYARANTTYAAVANQKAIVDATWHWTIEVYLCDKATTLTRFIANDAINNLFPPTASLGLDDEDNSVENGGE